MSTTASMTWAPHDPALVRRVNQLYHDLTQDVFDQEHRYRHRVERVFWTQVASLLGALSSEAALQPRTVVDLACGTGFVTRLLGQAMRPIDRLIAIDLSTSALHSTARNWSKHLRQRAALPSLIRLAGDGQQLPLPSRSIDLFAMNAGLHHVPDACAALREIDRVLKPGGWFALGFEPNLLHFASSLGRLSHGFDRMAWYASPKQNVRRLRERFSGSCSQAVPVTRTIEQRLFEEGAIDRPLSAQTLFDLVDPHARGTNTTPGFDAATLLREYFPAYQIMRLATSDYLGESARRSRLFRGLVDSSLRMLYPARGSLFSWIIRKPQKADRNGALSGGLQA